MALILEDFAQPRAPTLEQPSFDAGQLQAERTAGYEEGYSAGWDDAIKAEEETKARVSTEFARHLQEMSFTFHEARAHVLEGVQPVLSEIIATLLPAVVRQTLGHRILETLEPLIDDAGEQPILISVAPENRDLVEPIIRDAGAHFLRIEDEPTLTVGQAFLRLGRVERKIDLTEALDQISDAMRALSKLNEKVLNHD